MPPPCGTYCLVANHSMQSVRMTENRWNSTQAAEEYPRLDTSVIPGSTRFAGKDNSFSNHANNGG